MGCLYRLFRRKLPDSLTLAIKNYLSGEILNYMGSLQVKNMKIEIAATDWTDKNKYLEATSGFIGHLASICESPADLRLTNR